MSNAVAAEPITSLLERVRVHDVDTHVTEPPDLWTSRLPSRWKDMAPHPTIEPNGAEHWHFGDQHIIFNQAMRTQCFDQLTQDGSVEPRAPQVDGRQRDLLAGDVSEPARLLSACFHGA